MKILDVFKLFKREQTHLNIIEIGNTTYYIIEVKDKANILHNKLISKLMLLYIPLYWFSSYNEFEEYFIHFNTNLKNIFIIIY